MGGAASHRRWWCRWIVRRLVMQHVVGLRLQHARVLNMIKLTLAAGITVLPYQQDFTTSRPGENAQIKLLLHTVL
jgi:hypothetical protein